ncbi:MAG: protein kinase domain-containing protein [Acidimicrobiales bacterium]
MTTDLAQDVAAVLPDYEIGGELGRGAFGVVLAGRHRQLGRRVAIKLLSQAFSEHPEVRHRFAAEARILGLFDHPHIVPVFDYVEQAGLCALVIELLPGGTVRHRLRQHSLDARMACAVGLAACSALDYAHHRGVLHRDVKPDNLLFAADGLVKMTDFGIARVVGGLAVTRIGETVGTPLYMAPEQCTDQPLGPATDVYAAGLMLYELLAGTHPFSGSNDPMATMYRQIHEVAPPVNVVNAAVPEAFSPVVMRAMAKDPRVRYPSARHFGAAIAEAAVISWGEEWVAGDAARILSPNPVEPAGDAVQVLADRSPEPESAPVGGPPAAMQPSAIGSRHGAAHESAEGSSAPLDDNQAAPPGGESEVAQPEEATALADAGAEDAPPPGPGVDHLAGDAAPLDADHEAADPSADLSHWADNDPPPVEGRDLADDGSLLDPDAEQAPPPLRDTSDEAPDGGDWGPVGWAPAAPELAGEWPAEAGDGDWPAAPGNGEWAPAAPELAGEWPAQAGDGEWPARAAEGDWPAAEPDGAVQSAVAEDDWPAAPPVEAWPPPPVEAWPPAPAEASTYVPADVWGGPPTEAWGTPSVESWAVGSTEVWPADPSAAAPAWPADPSAAAPPPSDAWPAAPSAAPPPPSEAWPAAPSAAAPPPSEAWPPIPYDPTVVDKVAWPDQASWEAWGFPGPYRTAVLPSSPASAVPAPTASPSAAPRPARAAPGRAGRTGRAGDFFDSDEPYHSPSWPPHARNRARTTLVALAVAAVCLAVVAAVLLTTKKPAPASAHPPTTSQTPAQVAAAVNQLIQTSATARTHVVATVASIQNCSATGQAAATSLSNAIASRQQVVRTLQTLPVGELPNGAAMGNALTTALNDSVSADQSFRTWLAGISARGGCSGTAPTDANYQAGERSSTDADKAKQTFASLWNPVAATYGLPKVTSTTI